MLVKLTRTAQVAGYGLCQPGAVVSVTRQDAITLLLACNANALDAEAQALLETLPTAPRKDPPLGGYDPKKMQEAMQKMYERRPVQTDVLGELAAIKEGLRAHHQLLRELVAAVQRYTPTTSQSETAP